MGLACGLFALRSFKTIRGFKANVTITLMAERLQYRYKTHIALIPFHLERLDPS
jgi:hypothetical protein